MAILSPPPKLHSGSHAFPSYPNTPSGKGLLIGMGNIWCHGKNPGRALVSGRVHHRVTQGAFLLNK